MAAQHRAIIMLIGAVVIGAVRWPAPRLTVMPLTPDHKGHVIAGSTSDAHAAMLPVGMQEHPHSTSSGSHATPRTA